MAGTWDYDTCTCDCGDATLGNDGSCHKEKEEQEIECNPKTQFEIDYAAVQSYQDK